MAWAEAGGRRHFGFRAPALVLLAVACTLEGYAWLGTIGSPGFVVGPGGAALFALACLAACTHLTRPLTGGRRTVAERELLAACAVLAATTLTAVIVPGAPGARPLGATDLLVALASVSVATAGERRITRQLHSASHPSRLAPTARSGIVATARPQPGATARSGIVATARSATVAPGRLRVPGR